MRTRRRSIHFGQDAEALADSTANDNDAASSTAEMTPASLIGGGAKFAGSSVISKLGDCTRCV